MQNYDSFLNFRKSHFGNLAIYNPKIIDEQKEITKEDEVRKYIIVTAKNFIGKQEIRGNKGFYDPDFEKKMKEVGWLKDQAWCSYFVELIWKLAFSKIKDNELLLNRLEKLFSASAVTTYKHFLNESDIEVNKIAKKGSIVIWQNYKTGHASWTGHAGIVYDFSDEGIISVEGNTNVDGAREGYEVCYRNRPYNYYVNHGLRMLGFIHPNFM